MADLIPYITLPAIFLWMLYVIWQFVQRTFVDDTENAPLFYRRLKRKFFKRNRIEIMHHLGKFSYYTKLSAKHRELFAQRVSDFILLKKFIPKNECEITMEHKTLIAASAVQLTFGLDQYLLTHFSKIYIYPKKYYSSIKQQYHKGEVNIKGAIVLSLEDFIEGLKEGDGINLGLHEMAHALKFNNVISKEADDLFVFWYNKWQKRAEGDLERLNSLFVNDTILRDYAKENINEFFAVCVENFFERPAGLKNQFPELYENLKLVLNQDPENPTGPSPREKIMVESREKVVPANLKFKFVPSGRFLFYMCICIFALTLIMYSDDPEKNAAWYFPLFFMLPVFMFLSFKKILVYDNCITINTMFSGKTVKIFDFRQIDYIYIKDRNGTMVFIKYFENGAIKTYRFPWSEDKKASIVFAGLMKENGVSVRRR